MLDEPKPYHRLGLPQSWYPSADAPALGIDLTAQPGYAGILAIWRSWKRGSPPPGRSFAGHARRKDVGTACRGLANLKHGT